MFEKLLEDELFFHKVGLISGTVIGLLIGFVVSDRADRFEIENIKIEEVVVNGSEKS